MTALFIICGLGLFIMLTEIFKAYKLIVPITLIGICTAFITNLFEWNNNKSIEVFHNMIQFDNVSLAFSNLILLILFVWILLAHKNYSKQHTTDIFTLVLFSTSGALILTAFTNFTSFLLGVEILSIPMYVLAASNKNNLLSNESGFKYLLLGAFMSAFLILGITLIYGATGSFDMRFISDFINDNSAKLPPYLSVGILLVLMALCFKVSAAPFHFWTPDVYEGAPTIITTLMVTMVKTASVAAFAKLYAMLFINIACVWVNILVFVIILSLLIANLIALFQDSVKRIFAYSSISHTAFILMAFLSNGDVYNQITSVFYYIAAYVISNITAFYVLHHISNHKQDVSIKTFNALAKKSPFTAFVMTVALLSMAGIPITAGFFAKYFIFNSLINTPFSWVVILAIIFTAISLYYYFKIIIAMYFKEYESTTEELNIPLTHKLILVITTLLTIVLGIYPNAILNMF